VTQTVVFNLVELATIIAILHKTSGRTDAIVVVGVVLVYLSAAWHFQGLRRALSERVTRLDQHFVDLKGHLAMARDPGDAEAFEARKRLLVQQIGSYVDVRPPFTDGLAAENHTQPGAILIFIEGDA
jgi:hypothetical protein